MDSFKKFIKKGADRLKSGHLAWKAGDVQMHKKDKSTRQGHFAWGKNDVQMHKKDISEAKKVVVPTQLRLPMGLPKGTDPHGPVSDMEPSQEFLEDHANHRKTSRYSKPAHASYKSDSEGFVNSSLRHGFDEASNQIHLPAYDKGTRTGIKRMDYNTSLPSKQSTRTFRGYQQSFPIDHMEPGQEFTDHGYTGTSLRKEVAHSFADYSSVHPNHKVVAVINSPQGTRGHLLDHPDISSPLQHEKEYTLQRGTRFRVERHSLHEEMGDYGVMRKYHLVHLHVVGQKALPVKADK